jgi:hypothetical protein
VPVSFVRAVWRLSSWLVGMGPLVGCPGWWSAGFGCPAAGSCVGPGCRTPRSIGSLACWPAVRLIVDVVGCRPVRLAGKQISWLLMWLPVVRPAGCCGVGWFLGCRFVGRWAVSWTDGAPAAHDIWPSVRRSRPAGSSRGWRRRWRTAASSHRRHRSSTRPPRRRMPSPGRRSRR